MKAAPVAPPPERADVLNGNPLKAKTLPVEWAEEPDALALAGIWKDKPKMTLEKLRDLPALKLGFEKFPQNLRPFAVTTAQMEALANVFEDEPSAEVLCEMLTP